MTVPVMVVLALCFAQPLTGQDLTLKRDLPAPAERDPCVEIAPRPGTPTADERSAAQALTQEAAEALILGDIARARSLLSGAAVLDPTNAEIQFQLGRALEELDEVEAAVEAFCLHIELAPNGPDRAEAGQRIDRLVPQPEDPFPETARAAFRAGVERFDTGNYDEAVREFSRALVELPNWADAHFNRGLAYLRAGREGAGLSDLERYLELEPGAPEEAAIRVRLAERVPVPVRHSPVVALASGLVIPGMGQFYTGRTGMGAVYLVAAGAVIAAGVLYTEVEVQCLTIPGPDGCPPEFVVEEDETRPLLVPGLAGAAAITFIGAVHAFMSTRRERATANGLALRAPLPPVAGGSVSSVMVLNPALRGGRPTVDATLTIRF